MAGRSRRKLRPVGAGGETLGQRLARLRKQRGLTQVELARKLDIIQSLVSDYELDKLRPHPEMLVRFAKALKVSGDEILGLKLTGHPKADGLSLRLLRRFRRIEELGPSKKRVLLSTIDTFLKGAEK